MGLSMGESLEILSGARWQITKVAVSLRIKISTTLTYSAGAISNRYKAKNMAQQPINAILSFVVCCMLSRQ
jgi:hypothetical protein